MPYEPLVLLHRLAPEDVNHLIRQNPPPPANQSQNAQTFQNKEGINTQSLEKDLVVNISNLPLETKQKLTCTCSPKSRVLKSNSNGVNHDKLEKAKFSKDQKGTNSRKGELFINKSKLLASGLFEKELVVVIDNCYNDMIYRDMVNSTAQHPKTRNPSNLTVATNSNTTSNNSVASTKDSAVGKGHIINDTIMITTTKSPLSTLTPAIEVIDKKTKDILLNGQQHITAGERDKQTNCDKVQYDSSGLSLRTRTISTTTVPTPLHNCSTSSVTTHTPRPRGRPPRRKNLKRIADRKAQQQAAIKLSEENKVCDLPTSPSEIKTAAMGLEYLQQQQNLLNECNSIESYDDDQENSETIVRYTNKAKAVTDNTHSTSSLHVDDDDCYIVKIAETPFKKKSNNRKRKQSNIEETIAEKRLHISDGSKDLLVEKNVIEKPSLPEKSDPDLVEYGFLGGYNSYEPYRQYAGFKSSSSNCHSILYGQTYWPTSWEYSAASLTGHVQKKTSKEALRKIRLISEGANSKTSTVSTSLKTNSTLKKYQTSVLQRRGSAGKPTAIVPVEVSGGTKHPLISTTIVKRQKGRPPGRKNKVIQAVVKSNSPRKSPRQHASTLAAILSSKGYFDKFENQQPDKLEADVETNKNSLDMDVPCLLKMSVTNYEHMSGFRHHRHRRQLDNKCIIKRRRRRSTTPPPPKLCAQQPAPQRVSMNTSMDQERVKLRTKHVDVVRRRARDERLRASFVCQQLHKVQEIAEQNRRRIAQEVIQTNDENKEDYQFSTNAIILPFESDQDQIWSQIPDINREPDNMCLQIMYEQTADKRFLYTNLTDETLQMYYQQRELALTERLTSNHYGETLSSDLGADMISSKRKKKRPNMTGWPKEKRRKIIATTSSINTAAEDPNDDSDTERDDIAKRRRAAAAEQQRLRRQRIKLEEQQLLKEKSKVKMQAASPKQKRGRRPGRPGRPGRRPGPNKKNKSLTYRRNNSVSSNDSTTSSNTSSTGIIKIKKVRKPRKQRTSAQNKTTATVSVTTDTSNTVVKRRCGRPVGSIGRKQRLKLEMLQQHCQNQTTSEQQKENVQQQSSTSKLKCVISTRNNRMKLLSTFGRSPITSSQKKMTTTGKTKKSGAAYNLSSSCLTSLPSSQVAVVSKITRTTKRRRLQQHQQTATATVTWDVGRPKRYSSNHSRNASCGVVEEDCCFVGSQPFEQHCPGGGGLSHNTVLENHQDHQKENTVHGGL